MQLFLTLLSGTPILVYFYFVACEFYPRKSSVTAYVYPSNDLFLVFFSADISQVFLTELILLSQLFICFSYLFHYCHRLSVWLSSKHL